MTTIWCLSSYIILPNFLASMRSIVRDWQMTSPSTSKKGSCPLGEPIPLTVRKLIEDINKHKEDDVCVRATAYRWSLSSHSILWTSTSRLQTRLPSTQSGSASTRPDHDFQNTPTCRSPFLLCTLSCFMYFCESQPKLLIVLCRHMWVYDVQLFSACLLFVYSVHVQSCDYAYNVCTRHQKHIKLRTAWEKCSKHFFDRGFASFC